MDHQPKCMNCNSSGWVCERHNDTAFEACECGGAGEPCQECNKGNPPRFTADSTIIFTREEGWAN